MPYLIENPEEPNVKIHQLQVGINSIGREGDNSIQVMDKSVSRYHAQIMLTPEKVMLRDLESLNQTFINGIPIKQQQLQHGDWICCGNLVFKYTLSLESEDRLPHGETPQLTIFSRLLPEQTQIDLEDLISQDNYETQGSVLKLRHQDDVGRSVDKLKILLAVSKQLSSLEEPEKLLGRLLDLLLEIMSVDRAVVLMVNPTTGKLEQKAVKYREHIPTEEQFYSSTITRFVRENGVAILSSDAFSDQRFSDAASVMSQEIRASMCVPLKPQASVIGVLYADNLSRTNVYSQEDLEFLTGLVNQAAIAIENARLNQQIQAEVRLRSKLENFFPETVTRKLKEEGKLETVDAEATILFADISGFTQMSSRREPRTLIETLNEYFTMMVEEIVFPYGGTLDKYMGDGLLAMWGAPYNHADDAQKAVQAAIAMQQGVRRLNARWQKQGKEPIQIHIGLNTGKVAAGNIGSQKLIQYTAIGDTVNVASRVCSVAQADEILISQSTFSQLISCPVPLLKMPPVRVKGKEEPLELYRLLWNRQLTTDKSILKPQPRPPKPGKFTLKMSQNI